MPCSALPGTNPFYCALLSKLAVERSDGASWLHELEYYSAFKLFCLQMAVILFAAAQGLNMGCMCTPAGVFPPFFFFQHFIAWRWSNTFVFRSKAWKALFQKTFLTFFFFFLICFFWPNNCLESCLWLALVKILKPDDRALTLYSASVCPAGGAGDRFQGYHWEGVPAQGHCQQAGSQPL